MKRISAVMTEQGQVTIPAEIRERLGLKPRDHLVFEITDEGDVHLAPAVLSLEATAGSVEPHARPEDFKAIARAVKEERVEKTMRKLRRS